MHRDRRAEIHAVLGDVSRLAIVDELSVSDRSPSELSATLGIPPPLLSFHLGALERAGVITRLESAGDRRRKYLQLVPGELDRLGTRPPPPPGPVLFVCTHNSARSQLAAALWRHTHDSDATSAGTTPAERVHPGAVAAARRAGLDLGDAVPRRFDPSSGEQAAAGQIVTVCDRAYEDLRLPTRHWSIPDPVEIGSDAAFDRALDLLRHRITGLAPSPSTPPAAPPDPSPPTEAT